jgi:hypothetical protein
VRRWLTCHMACFHRPCHQPAPDCHSITSGRDSLSAHCVMTDSYGTCLCLHTTGLFILRRVHSQLFAIELCVPLFWRYHYLFYASIASKIQIASDVARIRVHDVIITRKKRKSSMSIKSMNHSIRSISPLSWLVALEPTVGSEGSW